MRSAAGSIEKLGNGRWKIYINYGYDPRTGRRKRKCKTIRGSRRDAELLKSQMLLDDSALGKMRLGEYAQIYLECKKDKVRPVTLNGYRKNVDQLMDSDLAFIKIAEVEKHEQQVREWIYEPKTAGAQMNRYATLRQILRQAKRKNLIRCCVTDFIDPPKSETPEKETITSETLPAYLAAVRGLCIEAGILVMLGCGLRRSEALGLRWDDIQWEQGEGYYGRFEIVRGCYTAKGGGVYFDEPKTSKSRREILMPEWVGSRLHEIYKESHGEYLCEDEEGLICPDRFTKRWIRTLKNNGLPKILIKNLRHSCGTMLVREACVPVSDVQQLLGHTSYHTTETFYVQKSEVSSHRVANAMSDLFKKNR